MALISCPECQTEVSDKAVSCPKCGCPIASLALASQAVPGQASPIVVTTSKSRGVYIILGLFFGGLAIHNFYAGQNTRGAVKCGLLLVALLLDAISGFRTGFSLLWMVICAVAALWEIITTTADAAGTKMT